MSDTSQPTDVEPDVTVDARGSTCPGPLMDLIGTVKGADPDTVVELQTSDSASSGDVPDWVDKAGHELLGLVEHEDEGHWSIYVRTT
jgi:TusA-related sulfurtransferase